MNDQTSLDLLNDIVQPDVVSWWPPAPGWFVLAGFLALLLLIAGWWGWKKWRRNRYRRQALQELAAIEAAGDAGSLARLPVLLKRAALCAWPRPGVAALNGSEWHEFLDRTAGGSEFVSGAGEVLDRLAYGTGDKPQPTVSEQMRVLRAAENWLRRHDGSMRAA